MDKHGFTIPVSMNQFYLNGICRDTSFFRVHSHRNPRVFCGQGNDVPFLFVDHLLRFVFGTVNYMQVYLCYTFWYVFEVKHWFEPFEMYKTGFPKLTFGVLNFWFHHMCYITWNITMKHLNGFKQWLCGEVKFSFHRFYPDKSKS